MCRTEQGDFVVEPRSGQSAVTLPILWQTQLRAGNTSLDKQEPIEIEQGIAQCHLALQPTRAQIESTEFLPLGFGFRNLQCFGNCVAKLFVVSLLVAQPLDIRALHRLEVADHSLRALQHLVQSQRHKIQHCLARTPILLRESQVQDPWSSNIGIAGRMRLHQQLVGGSCSRTADLIGWRHLDLQTTIQFGQERNLGYQMAWRGPHGNVLQVAACRGPVESPAVRERDRRFKTKGTDMRHARPGAKQFDRVLALRDAQLAL